MEKGEYEVTVVGYESKKASTGSSMVTMTYEVRDDVNQPSNKGQKINYDNFVATKNSMWRFQALSKAAGVPEGTKFDSIDEWAKTMQNKNVRVVVGLRDHEGRSFPQVNSFKESEVGKPETEVNISSDDVPF